MVNVVARHVDGLVQLRPEQLPGRLKDLGVPPGWAIALVEGGNVAPSRITVYGPHSDGRWDGCETITVFGFTGEPPEDAVTRVTTNGFTSPRRAPRASRRSPGLGVQAA